MRRGLLSRPSSIHWANLARRSAHPPAAGPGRARGSFADTRAQAPRAGRRSAVAAPCGKGSSIFGLCAFAGVGAALVDTAAAGGACGDFAGDWAGGALAGTGASAAAFAAGAGLL